MYDVRRSTGERNSTRRLRRQLFHQAAAIVRDEYASDLTVDDVAHRVATSPRQLRRAFAEAGVTFRDCLAAVRMRHAAALLRDSDLSVEAVGVRVGYRHPSQFTKAFKRRHGVTPSEYPARGASAPTRARPRRLSLVGRAR